MFRCEKQTISCPSTKLEIHLVMHKFDLIPIYISYR